MGRAKGKGKKQTVIEVRDSNEEKKVPVVVPRKRGRPLKSMKEEVAVVVIVESVVEEEIGENVDDLKSEHGNKRKRSSLVKENNPNSNGEDAIVVAADEPVRPVGFRQNGSRRKSKPRRAAEVGVECS